MLLKRSKSLHLKGVRNEPPEGTVVSGPHVATTGADLRSITSTINDVKFIAHRDGSRGTLSARARPRTASAADEQTEFLRSAGEVLDVTSSDQTFQCVVSSSKVAEHSIGRLAADTTIGVALGSPTASRHGRLHSANCALPRTADTTVAVYETRSNPRNTLRRAKTEGKRARTSTWRTIGELFQRRSTKPPASAPFYQCKQSDGPPTIEIREVLCTEELLAGPERASEASEELSPPGLVTGRQAAGETARCTIQNEKDVMLDADLQEGTTLLTGSVPNPSAKDQPLQRTKARTTTLYSDHLNEPRQQPETPPMLEINVPDIELERYSVMFRNLLQSYQRTSLLVRRGTDSGIHRPPNGAAVMADHINTPDGATQQQWVTSAPPAKSSTFSLFPRSEPSQPRAASMAIHKPRPLKRSYTASAVPLHATATSARVKELVLVPPLPSSTLSEKALPLTPTHSDRMSFSEDEIALVSHGLGPLIPQVEEPP
ncbi:hypothetical protein LTR16_001204 [Cryomyces antarcticus]|uniref:Uncharacterized protein n=1 Tax=Cryomyces antarcticus TaxID=329879 RepID=A0ABR0KU38_9PEZI|nr:hypothetical protein LTR16_001204 [Cryomyces antarcticus]